MLLLSISLVLFSRLDVHSGFWDLLPAMIVGGFGMASAMTPTTAAAMAAVRPDKAGVASAVLNSMRQVGGSLGIAVIGAIVASRLDTSLRAGNPRPVAFTHGLQGALEVAAVIALTGSAIAFATVRKVHHEETAEQPLMEAA